MTKTLTEQQIRKIIEKGTLKAAKVCEKKFYGKPKSLTEQWRDGTLPLGTYYILNINGDEEIDRSVAVGELWNNTDLKEVLAHVPSYDEWQAELDSNNELLTVQKRLEKRLEIATKALKDVAYLYIYTDKDLSTVANNALKEMEGVK